MERFPQSNEPNEQGTEKQILSFDAKGETGNVFSIIGNARALLEGEQREAFMDAINEATKPNAGKNYEDILAIVNEHVRLVDTSGHYPAYGYVDAEG